MRLKIFDSTGMVTLVSPPSMMKGGNIGFTLVNIKEKEKNYFAKEVNKVFPDGIARDLISGGEIDWSKDGELVLRSYQALWLSSS